MAARTIEIEVDEQGRSCEVDGNFGAFGEGLSEGDTIEIDDRSYRVVSIGSRIHTRQYAANYIIVDVERQ